MKMEKKPAIKWSTVVPLALLVGLALLFGILTKWTFFSAYNLKSLVTQMIPFLLCGSGMIFVVATGGIDMSHGSVVAVSAMISALAAQKWGMASLFPAALAVGFISGLIVGEVVVRLKVPSFMMTLAIQIAFRAVTKIILVYTSVIAPASVMKLDSFAVKVPLVVAVVTVCWFLFEKTPFGYSCKGMGENERALIYAGVNTKRFKILAFVISGLLASFSGAMTMVRVGGANANIGTMTELRVMMALYVGGIAVTGGSTTKMYKLLLGAPIIAILENGLTLCNVSPGLHQMIEGGVLIFVVAVSLLFYRRSTADARAKVTLGEARGDEEELTDGAMDENSRKKKGLWRY